MVAGYGETPQTKEVATTQQQQTSGYDDYDYPGNTFRNVSPNDQAAQVRKAIFDVILPDEDADFELWIPMLVTAVDMVARIPGINQAVATDLNRRMEDIVELSHSGGMKRVVASKMQKLIFRLRSYVAVGDTPIPGMTGVSAMISSNVRQEQTIRMPQQPASVGFWPWSRRPQQ